jgi:hypothetical protein
MDYRSLTGRTSIIQGFKKETEEFTAKDEAI